MSLYPSDGDIKFGWNSFGRSFAHFGALALAVAAWGFWAMHASSAHALNLDGQLLAIAAEWIGGGLSAILAFAAWGSLRISVNERGNVEITPEGVRRIFSPGKTDFLPLEQIAGFMGRPSGGVLLIVRAALRATAIASPNSRRWESNPCLPTPKGSGDKRSAHSQRS